MDTKKAEAKQNELCRMRGGWCRDCESSEYKLECMEKAEADPFAWITPETAARLTKPLKFSIMEKAEARNAVDRTAEIIKDMGLSLDGDMVMFNDTYEASLKNVQWLFDKIDAYASLREAQAVADYNERVKAKLNDESFMGNACLSYQHDFGLLPLVTKQAIENDYKEWRRAMLNNGLLDTTN
jgi:hypothetical protein